jgi:hypothetical protein
MNVSISRRSSFREVMSKPAMLVMVVDSVNPYP